MILKKLDELESLIDVPNVDENPEQSINAIKMLNAINDIRSLVNKNAVLQHVRHIVCPDCGCNKLQHEGNNQYLCLSVICDFQGQIMP